MQASRSGGISFSIDILPTLQATNRAVPTGGVVRPNENQSKGDNDTVDLHRAADAWVHPRSNEIFVADGYGNHCVAVFDADSGAGQGIAIVERKTLEIVGMIQVPGQLGPGHHLATDSKGNLYIAQTAQGLQKLVFKGMSAPR